MNYTYPTIVLISDSNVDFSYFRFIVKNMFPFPASQLFEFNVSSNNKNYIVIWNLFFLCFYRSC
jgi:hypothetical protein